jgi:hypothetical protein
MGQTRAKDAAFRPHHREVPRGYVRCVYRQIWDDKYSVHRYGLSPAASLRRLVLPNQRLQNKGGYHVSVSENSSFIVARQSC